MVKKLMIASGRHPETKQYLKSQTAISEENRRQLREYKWYIIHPLSQFRNMWKIFMFLLMLIHALIVPFIMAFSFSLSDDCIHRFVKLDILMCVLLLFEVPLRMITGYIIKRNKEIVLAWNEIIENYLRSTFLIDLIGSVPYLILIFHIKNNYLEGYWYWFLLYNVYIYVLNMMRFPQLNDYFLSIPSNLNLNEKYTLILKLVLSTLYLLHWTCCLRYSIVNIHYFDMQHELEHLEYKVPSKPVKSSLEMMRFVYSHVFIPGRQPNVTASEIMNSTLFHNYLRSFMFTTKSGLLVGNAVEADHELFSIIIAYLIIIGGFIWNSYCLFTGVQILFATDISTLKYEELHEEILVFCHAKRLSAKLKRRLMNYYKHRYQGHYFSEINIRKKISDRLKREILMHTCHSLVTSVSIFANLPRLVIENIIESLIFEIYLPNDMIVQADTEGEAMYMIAFGTACVVLSSGEYAYKAISISIHL